LKSFLNYFGTRIKNQGKNCERYCLKLSPKRIRLELEPSCYEIKD